MGRSGSRHERDEKYLQVLIGKPELNKRLGRPCHRREDNIKMDLKNIIRGLGFD
jgi:hypothetical protein